jgi:hypothetical protein
VAGARVEFGAKPGKMFAKVRFRTEQGSPLDLASLRGKVVLLIPMASWRPPRVASIRSYASVWKSYRDQPDVRVLIYNYKERHQSSKLAMQRNGGGDVELLNAGNTGVKMSKG